MIADPGWTKAVAGVWRTVVFFGVPPRSLDGLSALRSAYLGFFVALGIITAVLPVITEPKEKVAPWMFGAVGVAGLAGIVVAIRARRRRLTLDDPSSLAGSYRTHMFLGMAVSLSAASFGFVASRISGHLSPFLLGLGFAVVGMLLVAPSRRHIARRQRDLATERSSLDLVQALMETPPRSPRTP